MIIKITDGKVYQLNYQNYFLGKYPEDITQDEVILLVKKGTGFSYVGKEMFADISATSLGTKILKLVEQEEKKDPK